MSDSGAVEGETFGAAGGEPVELVLPDGRDWPGRFALLRDRLHEAVGAAALAIDHVGSTAVPGLAAKPVVDVLVQVADLDDEDRYRPPIEALGWPLRWRGQDRRFFRPPAGTPRTVHVHVCAAGSLAARQHLLFPAYLRAHPARRDAYAALKAELVLRWRNDRLAYAEAKTPFIAETMRLAEPWATGTGWPV